MAHLLGFLATLSAWVPEYLPETLEKSSTLIFAGALLLKTPSQPMGNISLQDVGAI